jgi:hypothetical protein
MGNGINWVCMTYGGMTLAKKKTFNNMEEQQDKMEKVGGRIALGVIITLLVIIAIVMAIKIQSNHSNQEQDQSTAESTIDLNKFDLIDTSSQLEEETTSILASTSDNDPETTETSEENSTPESTGELVLPSELGSESSATIYNKEFLDATEHPEITILLKRYFKAYQECNATELIQIVDYNGGTPVTMEELTNRSEIVEAYQNLKCYIISGMDESSFVVYASYDIKFFNIDTPAPTLTRFYVVTTDDGDIHIYNGAITAKLNAYLKTVDEYESIRALSEGIDAALDEACSQDERLEQLMQILYGRESEEETGGQE